MSTSHRLLTSAAARLGSSASAPAIASTIAAPPAPAAPAAQSDADPVDVVTLVDAQAAVAAAEQRGADAERARTSAVMSSDAGKANPSMAAFMLNSNPGANADAIVAHLKTMPAATATAPAPSAEAAPPAPAAPAGPAMTHNLNDTPRIEVGPDANQGGADGLSAADADKFWASATAAAATAHSPFGPDLAPGLPRTGN